MGAGAGEPMIVVDNGDGKLVPASAMLNNQGDVVEYGADLENEDDDVVLVGSMLMPGPNSKMASSKHYKPPVEVLTTISSKHYKPPVEVLFLKRKHYNKPPVEVLTKVYPVVVCCFS